MNKDTRIIETNRLHLTPVNQTHLPIYQEILKDDEMTKYLPRGKAYNDDEIQHHLDNRIKHWAENGYGSYVIFEKHNNNTPIGYVGIEKCPTPEFSDIRYALSHTMQGKGYVKEASLAVLAETFKLGQHEKIYGVSLADNVASINVLKKINMVAEPNVYPYGKHDGLIIFSIAK